MNAVKLHGGGEVLERISFNVGRLDADVGQGDVCLGMAAIVAGRMSSVGMLSCSSSASQSAGDRLRRNNVEEVEDEFGEKAVVFLLSILLKGLDRRGDGDAEGEWSAGE